MHGWTSQHRLRGGPRLWYAEQRPQRNQRGRGSSLALNSSGATAAVGRVGSPAMTAAERANQEMVDRLIAQEALWSPRLIAAFRQTPRHRFLERIHQHGRDGSWREVDVTPLGPSEIALVYSDRALTTRLSPASSGAPPVAISSSSQPTLIAKLLEVVRPAPGRRPLEVGCCTDTHSHRPADVD